MVWHHSIEHEVTTKRRPAREIEDIEQVALLEGDGHVAWMLSWRRMHRAESRDQLAIVLAFEASRLEEMAQFYVEIVGLEEERRWVDREGVVSWIDLRDGALRLKLARVGAVEGMSDAPTQGATLLIEVPDIEGRRRAVQRRDPDLQLTSMELGGASAWQFTDPAGHQIWFVHYGEESPDRIGQLRPRDELTPGPQG